MWRLTRFSETVGGKPFHGTQVRTKSLPLLGISKGVNHPGAHAAGTTKRFELKEGPLLQILSYYRAHVGLLLVDADVSCGADASRGQGLEDNRCV